MQFNDYINQLGQLDKQEIEAELSNFYTFNTGLLQFFKGIDNQFQALLNSSSFNAKSVEVIITQTNQLLPELNNLKFEISMLEEEKLSDSLKTEIHKTIKYIKEVMVLSEISFTKQRFIKILQENELKFRAEQQEIEKKKLQEIEEKKFEQERLEKEKLEKERIQLAEEQKKKEQEEERKRLEKLRIEAEAREQARIAEEKKENERIEQERQDRLRLERIRIETEAKEKVRLEEEKKEKIRLERLKLDEEKKRKERERELQVKQMYEDGTVLLEPIIKGDADSVSKLIKSGANVNGKVYHNSALRRAIQYNRIEILKELIDSGAELDILDNEEELYLLKEAINGNNLEIVKLLINSGATLEHKKLRGYKETFNIVDWIFGGKSRASVEIKKYFIESGLKGAGRYEYFIDKNGRPMCRADIKKY